MTARLFTANSDYTVVDRSPLQLAPGDHVTTGPDDVSWPGWVWVTATDGRGSYVPQEILRRSPDSSATVTQPFSARDLSVVRGETVTALREVRGWLWCRNHEGTEGWLPEFVLSPAR
jgi:hypothetical protein